MPSQVANETAISELDVIKKWEGLPRAWPRRGLISNSTSGIVFQPRETGTQGDMETKRRGHRKLDPKL